MLAECVGGIRRAPSQILVKLKLLTKLLACLYRLRLSPLPFPNATSCRENLLDQLPWSEKDAICIGENDIFFCHCEVTEMGRADCFWIARLKPLGARWINAVTEDRKTNLHKFQSVSMATPDDYACQSTGLSFQGRQISYAAFICSSAVIDDKNIFLLCSSHDFQEDIHATIVSHRQNSTRHMTLCSQWANA